MKNEEENKVITPELISKFVAGKTTIEEWLTVLAAIRENPEIRNIVTTSLEINRKMKGVKREFFSSSEVDNKGKRGKNNY